MSTISARCFFARNDKLAGAVALESLKQVSGTENIEYFGSVRMSDTDWHAAHAVGSARTAIALARGRTSSRYRRGANDERIDTEGALGELLAASVFGPGGATIAPLVEWRPTPDSVDMQHDGLSYDVKAISMSKRQVNINRDSHVARRPRAYVLLHLASECVADLYVVTGAAVDGWQLRLGFSPYFAGGLPAPLPVETSAENAE